MNLLRPPDRMKKGAIINVDRVNLYAAMAIGLAVLILMSMEAVLTAITLTIRARFGGKTGFSVTSYSLFVGLQVIKHDPHLSIIICNVYFIICNLFTSTLFN